MSLVVVCCSGELIAGVARSYRSEEGLRRAVLNRTSCQVLLEGDVFCQLLLCWRDLSVLL